VACYKALKDKFPKSQWYVSTLPQQLGVLKEAGRVDEVVRIVMEEIPRYIKSEGVTHFTGMQLRRVLNDIPTQDPKDKQNINVQIVRAMAHQDPEGLWKIDSVKFDGVTVTVDRKKLWRIVQLYGLVKKNWQMTKTHEVRNAKTKARGKQLTYTRTDSRAKARIDKALKQLAKEAGSTIDPKTVTQIVFEGR
jgi:hypothetical protein